MEQNRNDFFSIVSGGTTFISDMCLPDMLEAAVMTPLRPGLRIRQADLSGLLATPEYETIMKEAVVLSREDGNLPASVAAAAAAENKMDATWILDQIKAEYEDDPGWKPMEHDSSIRPYAALADWHEGTCRLWVYTADAAACRKELAEMLGLPEEAMAVAEPMLKEDPPEYRPIEALVCLLSKKAGKPVLLTMKRNDLKKLL